MFDDEDVDEDDTWWVIPHWSSLDYCPVRITSNGADAHGRVFVEGRRSAGWTPDGASIRTRVPLDKLTKTPEWHRDFLALYEDPCNPATRRT